MARDMKNPVFIGIHGKQQAGKDELTRTLEWLIPKECGMRVLVWRFSDLVYDGAAAALGITKEKIKTEFKTECRPLLQEIGKCIRKVTPDRFYKSMKQYGQSYGRTVILIPDLRRIPDVEDIHRAYGPDNGVFVKVDTDRDLRKARAKLQGIELVGEGDVTETELDDYDGIEWFQVLNNNGSKGELVDQAMGLIDKMRTPFSLVGSKKT